MSLSFDNRIGLEDLQLAAFETLIKSLNDYIEQEELHGVDLDERIAIATNTDVKRTRIEKINLPGFNYGHRPSMIERPISEFPMLSVTTFAANASGENQDADYGNSFALKIALEVLVKSGPYDLDDETGAGEDVVGRRIHRTAEACHQLFHDRPDLGGYFMPPTLPPSVSLGEIFVREEDGDTATGARWYWQGVRLEYTYLKQTVFGS